MAIKQLAFPANRAFTLNSVAIPGATASLYTTGTLTPQNFLASDGVTSLGSTLTADGIGRFPAAYQDETVPFRLIIKDATGATVSGGDIDPIYFGKVTGLDSSVSIGTTTTGAAGSSASVTNSGTSSAAVFNFTIPTGAQGPAGDLAKAADRTALAAIAGATAGMARYLTETGREGTFVFDSSNNATNVTNDPQQGIYVAPASDTTGASGAWVRKYDGPVLLEWFGGGTAASDNLTAFQAIQTLFANAEIQLRRGTYLFSYMPFPTSAAASVRVVGRGRGATVIKITGDGGGAAGNAVNGGVRMFGFLCSMSDLSVTYNNPALQCLINCSHATAGGRNTFTRIDLYPSNVTALQASACTAIYMANQTETFWTEGQIGVLPNFGKNLVLRGFWNGCSFNWVTFRPHAVDIPNGAFGPANPLVDCDCSTQASAFNNCTFEQGPNGAKVFGNGSISFNACYFSDGVSSKNPTGWLPSQAVSQGDYIFPSASTTGSIDIGVSTTTLNLTSASAAYVGQLVTIIGAGASGANLTTRITALNGTAATIATAASTTVSGVGVYWGAYDGHGHVCTVAGTTGSSAPAFPTTVGGTVVDGTATWREYGSCAYMDLYPLNSVSAFGKPTTFINGCIFGTGVVGISAKLSGGLLPRMVSIVGCSFFSCDYAGRSDGANGIAMLGCHFNSYNNVGFELLASTGSSTSNVLTGNTSAVTSNAADFVISTNSTSMGGVHKGVTVLTGIGKARFSNEATGASAGLTLPGTLSVTGASALAAVTASSALVTSGSASLGVGYGTGAGAPVSQATSKSTGVTLNRPCGQITMNNAALAANTAVSFTLTSNAIAADDDVRVWVKSGNATPATYRAWSEGNSAGSRTIVLQNISAGSLSEAVVLGIAVMKAVTA